MRVLFWGSKQLGLRCLELFHDMNPSSLKGVVTIDDREDSRSVYEDLVQSSYSRSLPLVVARPQSSYQEIMGAFSPDLCLVVGWYRLFSETILQSASRGFIGIHNSLLPKYRGGSPLVWSIINHEKEVGFSIFSMTKGVDDGSIWAQGSVSLKDEDYIGDVLQKLETKTVEVLSTLYPRILDGSARPIPQDLSLSTFCAQRRPEDGLIDWTKPATWIYDFIRAQSKPYPGAFTLHQGRKIFLWKCRPETATYFGIPGQVVRSAGGEVSVICGDMKPLVLQSIETDAGTIEPAAILTSSRTRFACVPSYP